MSVWLMVVLAVLVWSVVGAVVFLGSARMENWIAKELPQWAVTLLVVLGGPIVWGFVGLLIFYFRRMPAK